MTTNAIVQALIDVTREHGETLTKADAVTLLTMPPLQLRDREVGMITEAYKRAEETNDVSRPS